MAKFRVDKLLVVLGYFSTRGKAQQAIEQGRVWTQGKQVVKRSEEYTLETTFELQGQDQVGRGYLKLQKALEVFKPLIENQILMDVGVSTGGFTQVLLQRGAQKIYAVDVGFDQLDPILKNDPRVINLEKTHILKLDHVPDQIQGFVIDVSFISVLKILEHLQSLGSVNCWVICLVKPQFEVGKTDLPKDGVVKDPKLWQRVENEFKRFISDHGWHFLGWIDSPIEGKSGNKEFLCYFRFQKNI